MWEQIQANKRKSIVLFFAMGACLLLLGYFLGAAYIPEGGGLSGVFFALALWGILSLISYFQGDSILLAVSKAKKVDKKVHPQLFNVVEEMTIAAGLGKTPDIYIIDSPALNAFATGRKVETSAIAVTAGLLGKLNRDELQGVVAHEMSHIVNRDVLFMTFAGILLGSIVLISEIFLRSMFYSSMTGRRYRSNSKSDSGQAQIVLMVIALVLAILAPIFAQLLYFAMSRKREYLADASAVRLTRYPSGLASALNKISSSTQELASATKATAGVYIANPLKKKGKKLSDITSTHPPISERIKILKQMGAGAGYKDYQSAAKKINASAVIPSSALKEETENYSSRAASSKNKVSENINSARTTGNIIRAINKYMFLTCTCGLKMKIPPTFKHEAIKCPKCGHINHRSDAKPMMASA